MEADNIKSVELLTESIKTLIGLSTLVFAGLAAYGTAHQEILADWRYIFAIIFLLLSALAGIVNINALINKVNKSDNDAIWKKDVVLFNILMSVLFILGLGFIALLAIYGDRQSISIEGGEDYIIISGENIKVGSNVKASLEIKKSPSGIIESLKIIPPKSLPKE